MRIGALVVTTGLLNYPGVASLLQPSGLVNAGQRIISVFQCCGVSKICLVTEKDHKKAQRQFAQNSVLFLHTETAETSTLEGARLGLRYMSGKFDRVFVVTGDCTLFLPETLRALLACEADIVIPTYSQINGCPILLTDRGIQLLLEDTHSVSLEQAVASSSAVKKFVPVNDPGTIIQGVDEQNRKALIEKQAQQLLRPAADIKIQFASLYFDSKLSTLMHLIDETGSVRCASELMQISYSTAWGMLNYADDALADPLVIRKRGGPDGSGCELSEMGRRMMNAYDQYCEAIQQKADALYQEMFQDFLESSHPTAP